jgi:cytochrome c-type biogenesis protein CcsB
MEKFSKAFFSMRMMSVAMIVFLVAIAIATFIESANGIQAAKILIYNALWFEILLVYLGMNLISNIVKYRMFQREKMAMLAFHVSFLIILIGAGVTRFVSFEGLMLIREGQSVDYIYSADPHLNIRINDGKMQFKYKEKMFMSTITSNSFSVPVEFPNHKNPIEINYVKFESKMIDTLVIDAKVKSSVLDIVTNGMQSNYVGKNDFLMAGTVPISFEKKNTPKGGIDVRENGGKVEMKTDLDVRYLPMSEMQKARQTGAPIPDSLYQIIPKNTWVEFKTTTLYQSGENQFVFKQLIQNAKKTLVPSGKKDRGSDYLTLEITDGNAKKIVQLKGGMNTIPEKAMFNFEGLTYELEYGSVEIKLPFSIKCRDFKLDKYPGSESPSSFSSDLTIEDPKNKVNRKVKVFMNNVVDYQGYRFFQSAYDLDDPKTPENEEGTRLSVNHDWWGTNITYVGYLLMSIGMILSLFAKTGRFKDLNGKLGKLKEKRSQLATIFLIAFLVIGKASYAQNATSNEDHNHEMHDGHDHSGHDHSNEAESNQEAVAPAKSNEKPIFRVISKEHSEELATLLVQDFSGRIIPFHTLCDQLIRKIYRSNKYKDYNAVQTVLSMHMYPMHWMKEPIIQVPAQLREQLKLKNEFASLEDVMDQNNGQFKWLKQYEEAFKKADSRKNEFDKKLIKLNEKFEVVQAIFMWRYMKIVPKSNDKENRWFTPLSSELSQTDSISSTLMLQYLTAINQAAQDGQYGKATDLLNKFKQWQRKVAKNIVPDETAVKMEVSYNKMGIFKNTYKSYLLLGFLMLVLFFIRIFKKPSPLFLTIFEWTRKILLFLLIVIFVYHGAGLGMRWYISGHAPWSNGYEAVVFIAWVTMIAGFSFMRKNAVIIAGTAVLASLMVFVTEMNLLDPEITPLVPVLKSYWLMIHVAIITGSYGFLGLAAILAILNLTLYIFRTKKNGELVTININELTYVSEMTMTIGLFMLTIGTFLGGIWANESWGRYWGWDPKETWALVSVLVYAVILHFRFIPALRGKFIFNVVSLWGYSAILFTFFGVNFFLVGLHSYAQGDGFAKLPNWVYVTIGLFILFTIVAAIRNRSYKKLSA